MAGDGAGNPRFPKISQEIQTYVTLFSTSLFSLPPRKPHIWHFRFRILLVKRRRHHKSRRSALYTGKSIFLANIFRIVHHLKLEVVIYGRGGRHFTLSDTARQGCVTTPSMIWDTARVGVFLRGDVFFCAPFFCVVTQKKIYAKEKTWYAEKTRWK